MDISCARYEYAGELCALAGRPFYIFKTLLIRFLLTDLPYVLLFYICNSPSCFLDVLLCHDDELEGRRVAFILYLVPPWQSSDGGTLDLYTADSEHPTLCVCLCVCVLLDDRHLVCSSSLSSGNFQPQSIVKSLVPSLNTLVLFEVSPVSFHQVRITAPAFSPLLRPSLHIDKTRCVLCRSQRF